MREETPGAACEWHDMIEIVPFFCQIVGHTTRHNRSSILTATNMKAFSLCATSFSLFCMLLLVPSGTLAQGNPIQLSLFNPVQIVPERESVNGLRLNLIFSKNSSLVGADLGLVNMTTGPQTGVQWGFVGIVEGKFSGWQWNMVSVDRGDFEGLQMGMYNSAEYVNGLQLGLINNAASMKGVQIGLVNIIKTGGAFPVFPIVNWSL